MGLDAAKTLRTLPEWRTASRCVLGGFVLAAPISGTRTLLAVGEVGAPASRRPAMLGGPPVVGLFESGADTETARAEMRCLVTDLAMTEGHEPNGLLARINTALRARGAGRIDSLALLSRAGDGIPADVAGAGRPLPLLVTPDRLSTPITSCTPLAPDWMVVLGANGPGSPPPGGLLPHADVAAATALLTRSPVPGAPAAGRTLLAVHVDG
ncbi:MAG: hypothetical protein NVSMB16_14950 [Acidimicrobiales bacterium]